MALPTTETDDQKLNPGQSDYDEKFNNIKKAEEDGSFNDIANNYDKTADDPQDKNKGVKDQEENPGYYNNFTGAEKGKLKSINGAHFLRKKGPLGLIITLLVGGGLGFTTLLSPALLIVQMKEVMVDKFNTQLASMDARTTKLISAKIDGTTGGICTGAISIKCKYSSMSDKQVAKFKAAGIDIETSGTGITGRNKPMAFHFEGGDPITAAGFNQALKENPNFRSAVKNAYNPKFAGFSDSIWSKFAARLHISKRPNITGETDPERAANLDDATRNGINEERVRLSAGDTDPNCSGAGGACSGPEADRINAEADRLELDAKSGIKAGAGALSEVEEAIKTPVSALGSLSNVFKVTGVADTACQAYGAVQMLGYAAKTVRAVQLARYAMAFLNTADMIKDGTAKPGDVAYLGGILTQIGYDAKSATKRVRGSATDSYGYKYAAYGDTGTMGNYSAQFLAGGGLTGDLINVTSMIRAAVPGYRETCKTLANPWVSAGSFVGGVALMIVPGGQAVMGGKLVVQAASQVAFSVALMVLPGLLKDVVAGNVTSGISGEDSGDAYASGAGGLMGGVANAGGNGALSLADAEAYNALQTDVIASYTRDEVAKLSPLDPTSRHTFLGSIVSSLLPSISTNLSSASGSISTIGSILSSSLSGLIPKTSALTAAQHKASLAVCQDIDYVDMKIATDPFCNVIYGIPPKYLDKDPLVVVDELGAKIDQATGEPLGEYKTFVEDCIDRVEPLGSDQARTRGDECKIDDTNANYYLHYVDQRVDNGMDGYDTGSDGAAADTGGATPVSGDTKSLAKQIIDSPNIKFQTAQEKIDFQQIVDSGSQTACGGSVAISSKLLSLILTASQKYKITIGVVAIGHSCNGGYHPKGQAIDINGVALIDQPFLQRFDWTSGQVPMAKEFYQFLDSTAGTINSQLELGQQQCFGSSKPQLSNTKFVDDTCNHLHVGVTAP